MVAYSLDQAQRDIASLRGQFAHLLATAEVVNLQVDGTLTVLDEISAVNVRLSGASAELTSRTCTAITKTQMTSLWSIPANDAVVGTVFRLTAWGNGTQGSTAENIQSFLMLNGSGGTTVDNTNMNISTIPNVAVNQGFHWFYLVNVIITGSGAGGTTSAGGTFTVSTATGTTSGNACTSSMTDSGNAIDTTASNTLGLFFQWNSATGAPTVTCLGSLMERLGP